MVLIALLLLTLSPSPPAGATEMRTVANGASTLRAVAIDSSAEIDGASGAARVVRFGEVFVVVDREQSPGGRSRLLVSRPEGRDPSTAGEPVGWLDAADALVTDGPVVSARRLRSGYEARLYSPAARVTTELDVLDRPAFGSPTMAEPHRRIRAHHHYFVFAQDPTTGSVLLGEQPRIAVERAAEQLIGWFGPSEGLYPWGRRSVRIVPQGGPGTAVEFFADPDRRSSVAAVSGDGLALAPKARFPLLNEAYGWIALALYSPGAEPLPPTTPMAERAIKTTDVVFLIDCSESMRGHREFALAVVSRLIGRTLGARPGAHPEDLRIAIGFYADVIHSGDLQHPREPLISVVDFSNDPIDLLWAIDHPPDYVRTYDPYESLHIAIGNVLRGQPWRANSTRIVVVVGEGGDRRSPLDPQAQFSAEEREGSKLAALYMFERPQGTVATDADGLLDMLDRLMPSELIHICGLHARDRRIVLPQPEILASHRAQSGRRRWSPPEAYTRFAEQLEDLADATGGDLWFTPEYIRWLDDAPSSWSADVESAAAPVLEFIEAARSAERIADPSEPTPTVFPPLDLRGQLIARTGFAVATSEAGGDLLPAIESRVAFLPATGITLDHFILIDSSELEPLIAGLQDLRECLMASSASAFQNGIDALYSRLMSGSEEASTGNSPGQVLEALGLQASDPLLALRAREYFVDGPPPNHITRIESLLARLSRDQSLIEAGAMGLLPDGWHEVEGREGKTLWLPVSELP